MHINNDENKRPLLLATSNCNHDSEETPRELAQLATIRNLTSIVEQLQEQTKEQTETVTLLRGTLHEVQSQIASPNPTHDANNLGENTTRVVESSPW